MVGIGGGIEPFLQMCNPLPDCEVNVLNAPKGIILHTLKRDQHNRIHALVGPLPVLSKCTLVQNGDK
jgi:hypothetical protein